MTDLTFSLNGVPNEDPNHVTDGKHVVALSTADAFEDKGDIFFVLRFVLDASEPPPYNGRQIDNVWNLTKATPKNKYWMKQFLLNMGVPAHVLDSWTTIPHYVENMRRIAGRKYEIRVNHNNGYQNIGTIKEYQLPGATTQNAPVSTPAQVVTTPAPAPVAPPVAPAPVSAPVANDPWATQAPQAATVSTPAVDPNDPWANTGQQAAAPAAQQAVSSDVDLNALLNKM